MSSSDFYPFYPKRILWIGGTILCAGTIATYLFLICYINFPANNQALPPPTSQEEYFNEPPPLSFSFNVQENALSFPLPRIESEITYSSIPPRPGTDSSAFEISIYCKQSSRLKRVVLPCRVDLQLFDKERVGFSDQPSPFWLELAKISNDQIQGTVWVEAASAEKIEIEKFIVSMKTSPLQGAHDFPEGSPFRALGEARWLGHDIFAEKYLNAHTVRISFGGDSNEKILDLQKGDWLVWNEGQWINGTSNPATAIMPKQETPGFEPAASAVCPTSIAAPRCNDKYPPIGRIESVDSKNLILEGWNLDSHTRLSLAPTLPSPFKMKGEEIISAIRIRSDKQISCMMEKQYLILRRGAWVLKHGGRWKILRKKDEKEAYKLGKMTGELFVLDKIEMKQGQKFIKGFIFNADRTQAISVDLAANQHLSKQLRKSKEK